jgi:16S rRNA (uracil1498-N3)-methyltransferase
MDRSNFPPIRSLPRVFVPGAETEGEIELPREEVEKFRKVLRLEEGSHIAVLPDDGSLIRCEFRARKAHPLEVTWPNTEPPLSVTVAQALPKGDRIDTVVQMCTEIGVKRFVFFGADRSVVRWDDSKRAAKLQRLNAIAREAAEQSFRAKLPQIAFERDLDAVLKSYPHAVVLSEVENLEAKFHAAREAITIVVGPEGGWSPHELELIGDRGVTLGPRVLRTDTAGPAAAAILLLQDNGERTTG